MDDFVEKKIMKDETDTRAFGLELAKTLSPGDVVALIGDLGSGKTALTKAIAEGLGIRAMVTSPTFNIVQEYHQGRIPLYHFDVYRIESIDEMDELGYEEYFYGQGVCVVEWADQIMELLPPGTILVRIAYGSESETERLYEIERLD